jgi:hypothetical protein
VILGQGVEHEFDPGRDPQFLENLESIVLDGMLAELQLLGNLAVRQAVSYQGDNFLFALRQQTGSVSHKISFAVFQQQDRRVARFSGWIVRSTE